MIDPRTARHEEVVITTDDPLLDAGDALLAARARDGDVHAYEVLARRHGPLMRVYASRLLGSDLESDDVVQDAFLTAWRRLGDLENPAQVRNWMMRIVSNKSIDRLRARRDHDDIDQRDPAAPRSQSPDRVVEARLQMDAMWTALDKLPLDQRRCWLLRETAEYSYAEIAEALGMSVSTVRGRIARARTFLMTEMEAWR
ncbi:sigma-70 family RNA polymerase sigma factor [Frigoribacterium sp. CFBP9039]|uniref:RNA polymerase sigma factor n=1 Tax=Frigoribacterium TaxID=96492 RepID=UPI001FAE1958|nr:MULTISPECIES: sigma-70 family RNA polymerase sigma factor [Frigoribacterium]MCJ0702357.1 sigma-70 family RNA polymerase sigma factor [Frigoribacterium faeni]MDY0892495.1 sigma-70 family RNA polymerase sigma factor [Frigoribacterium sp. CFBP9030]MDY0946224.1 sigma-70 family RNA polymerase sigma factor [Frigoribacterium sp. CFBP9039]